MAPISLVIEILAAAMAFFDRGEGIDERFLSLPRNSSARHGSCSFGLVSVREDEFERRVTDLKLRAARERIRAREEHGEGPTAFSGSPPEKDPLDPAALAHNGVAWAGSG
jgi:hypothetical protein